MRSATGQACPPAAQVERYRSAAGGQARLPLDSRGGQGTLEYLLVLLAILLALVYGVRQSGPIQSGTNSILTGAQEVMANAVRDAANRFNSF